VVLAVDCAARGPNVESPCCYWSVGGLACNFWPVVRCGMPSSVMRRPRFGLPVADEREL